MQQFNSKEKFRICNTLNCIPLLLQGHAVLIDLRNETSVVGVIDSADGFMNVNLTDAVLIDRNGGQHPFMVFMVPSRMVRQVNIPSSIDINKELKSAMATGSLLRKQSSKIGSTGKRSFKQKRAQERHKEILEYIRQQKEQENKDL